MQVFYGIEENYIDVSYLCHLHCKIFLEGIEKIVIPGNDNLRAEIFGDHIFGTYKHIKFNNQILGINQDVILNPEEIIFDKNSRKKWWNTYGKNIESHNEKLDKLHRYISLDFGSMKHELSEQHMAIRYVQEDDIVLELGGNIGRNSCIIATILKDDKNLVVLECSDEISQQLKHNRDKNHFNFSIEDSALSKIPLYQYGWDTSSEKVNENWTPVKTISIEELRNKYNLKFNILVADCEGALYNILRDMPELLDGIDTVIIENDFPTKEQMDYVHNKFLERGLKLLYNRPLDFYFAKFEHSLHCFFQVYTKIN
jgi:FkbM family methyltransferase